jgi:hypothetical protein
MSLTMIDITVGMFDTISIPKSQPIFFNLLWFNSPPLAVIKMKEAFVPSAPWLRRVRSFGQIF